VWISGRILGWYKESCQHVSVDHCARARHTAPLTQGASRQSCEISRASVAQALSHLSQFEISGFQVECFRDPRTFHPERCVNLSIHGSCYPAVGLRMAPSLHLCSDFLCSSRVLGLLNSGRPSPFPTQAGQYDPMLGLFLQTWSDAPASSRLPIWL
jgi:hypothetical protein